MSIVYRRLATLRKKNNLSQKDIAELLGIHQTTYGSYERGLLAPSIDTLIFLANYYHTSVDYLVGRTDQK